MKLKFLSLVVVGLLFSCSSDDSSDNSGTENVSIEGTWKLTEYKSENAYDYNNDGISNRDLMLELDCLTDRTLVFNENESGTLSYSTQIAATGQSITCSEIGTTLIDGFNWSKNGSEVSMNYDITIHNGVISGNKLTIMIPNEVIVLNNGNLVEEDLTKVYTKQ
ncbi:lipocalin family protein [Pseudofulvibacter geojedonensis]|uniref:Lipocalin family protein n=1 Tax=Pseudofulvibacter geojedonensis TaxID=1123758 RepID=A0ABW3I5Z5_9FLAO